MTLIAFHRKGQELVRIFFKFNDSLISDGQTDEDCILVTTNKLWNCYTFLSLSRICGQIGGAWLNNIKCIASSCMTFKVFEIGVLRIFH